jgi:hypothetical protein
MHHLSLRNLFDSLTSIVLVASKEWGYSNATVLFAYLLISQRSNLTSIRDVLVGLADSQFSIIGLQHMLHYVDNNPQEPTLEEPKAMNWPTEVRESRGFASKFD